MVQFKSIFVVLSLALAQVAFAGNPLLNRHAESAVTRRTNAARMAAGFPPNPPPSLTKRTGGGHHHGGGGGRPPSPPSPPKPSPKPDCDDKKKVRIKCNKKGGGFVGWVGKDFSSKDKNKRGFGLCNRQNDALEIDFENSVTPFDMKIPSRQDFPFLGWAGNNLGAGNSAVLTGTKKTNINNSPSNVGNAFSSYSANSESQVWYYTRNNKKFESKWVNSGGMRTESKTFYNPDDDNFHLVTDSGSFTRRNPRAYEVELELDE